MEVGQLELILEALESKVRHHPKDLELGFLKYYNTIFADKVFTKYILSATLQNFGMCDRFNLSTETLQNLAYSWNKIKLFLGFPIPKYLAKFEAFL